MLRKSLFRNGHAVTIDDDESDDTNYNRNNGYDFHDVLMYSL